MMNGNWNLHWKYLKPQGQCNAMKNFSLLQIWNQEKYWLPFQPKSLKLWVSSYLISFYSLNGQVDCLYFTFWVGDFKKVDISTQKYSGQWRLLCVKGLVICFYLGWFDSILPIRNNIIKVGSKSWLLTCSSNITLSLPSYTGSVL